MNTEKIFSRLIALAYFISYFSAADMMPAVHKHH